MYYVVPIYSKMSGVELQIAQENTGRGYESFQIRTKCFTWRLTSI